MMEKDEKRLIFDWNLRGPEASPNGWKIEFDDETLRDGLQSPSVNNPPIEDKIKILHLMDDLGIHSADIGLPGAGLQAAQHVEALAREIVDSRLSITPNCAARTLDPDILPIIEISQRVGKPIEACLFIGSSPIRQYAEGWTLEEMLGHTRRAVRLAVGAELPVMYVTEDTIRAHPDDLVQLYMAAIDEGASRVCLCDTVGHATPNGAFQLTHWMKNLLRERGLAHIKVDWHGHMDRGLGIWNTISAIEAGADRVHGTALGIGERVGNTPMDLLLVNLKLLGWISNDLHRLNEYCELVAKACRVEIHHQYPVFGADAFETGTGVHAAAVIKAMKKGDNWLADRVYSGVPAGDFGRRQKIRVGPMSGKSNVLFWLRENGFEPTDELVDRLFEAAKESARLFTDEELRELASQKREGKSTPQ